MKTEIMISVYPKYTDLIKRGYKEIEYRYSVPKCLKHGDIVWIYESKKQGGSGKVIGHAIVDCVIPMDLITQQDTPIENLYDKDICMYINYGSCSGIHLPLQQAESDVYKLMQDMKQRYYTCVLKNTSKNQMQEYLSKIGAGSNYAILFKTFVPCTLELSDFVYTSTRKHIHHAPQNFYYVYKQKR